MLRVRWKRPRKETFSEYCRFPFLQVSDLVITKAHAIVHRALATKTKRTAALVAFVSKIAFFNFPLVIIKPACDGDVPAFGT